MFLVYKISNTLRNEYYISYSPHSLPFILHKKLSAFYANKQWHPCFLIFATNAANLSIEEIAVCETEKECIEKMNQYMHFNGSCVNYRQNPYEF